MMVQIKEAQGNIEEARAAITTGTGKCSNSVSLWIVAAQLESRQGQPVKARSLLEKARLKNPKNQQLWLESIRLENNSENKKLAATRLAQALQECPHSGILWSEAILMEPRQQRKAKRVAQKSACNRSLLPYSRSLLTLLVYAGKERGRYQDVRERSLCHLYHCASLPHRSEAGQGARVVQPCLHPQPGFGRRVGILV